MDAFDPERFRQAGHAVVDRLADYLAEAEARRGPVLPVTAYGAGTSGAGEAVSTSVPSGSRNSSGGA